MKIASFNVENLFDRARAFNLEDRDRAGEILAAVHQLNTLFEKLAYSAADKTKILAALDELGLLKTDRAEFAELRRIRGKLLRRPTDGSDVEVVAAGRDDWIGWVELRTAPVTETAIMNTGRVIKDVNADVLAVIEAEGRVELNLFSRIVLKEVQGEPYEQVMVIDGNDERGIDVGLLTKNGYEIGLMRSHIHEYMDNGEPIYSRDCPEYEVKTPSGETIWVLPNHFKSKMGGDDPKSRAKREAQAKRTAEIYKALIDAGHNYVIVLGDLNDTPDSAPLQKLLNTTTLKDVSEHASFDTGEYAGRGTFGLGNDGEKIDYLLLSPDLFEKVTASGLFRKGAWPGKRPKRWTVYDTVKTEKDVASDHHVIWAEINI